MTTFEPTDEMARTGAGGMENMLMELANVSHNVEYHRQQYKRDADEWKSLTRTQLELHFAVPLIVRRKCEFERAAHDATFATRFWKNFTLN